MSRRGAAAAEERRPDEDNVKLATSQSKRQGDMLREGTWAHEVGAPEVGGLLSLPLETQLAVAKTRIRVKGEDGSRSRR